MPNPTPEERNRETAQRIVYNWIKNANAFETQREIIEAIESAAKEPK